MLRYTNEPPRRGGAPLTEYGRFGASSNLFRVIEAAKGAQINAETYRVIPNLAHPGITQYYERKQAKIDVGIIGLVSVVAPNLLAAYPISTNSESPESARGIQG